MRRGQTIRSGGIAQGSAAQQVVRDSYQRSPRGACGARFMRFVAVPTLGIERFALPVDRRGYALSKMSRLGKEIIDVPQSFSEDGRLQRIHGDRAIELQSVLPIS